MFRFLIEPFETNPLIVIGYTFVAVLVVNIAREFLCKEYDPMKETRKELLERFSKNPEHYAAKAWGLIYHDIDGRTNAQRCEDEGKTLIEGYREHISNLPEYDGV